MKKNNKKALISVNLAGFLNFLWNDILTLKALGYDVEIVMNAKMPDGSYAIEVQILKEMGVPYYHVDFDSKNPFSNKNITAFRRLKEILKNGYQLVHCHTPIVGLLTRIAGNKYRKKGMKIIYTTHGFPFTDRSSKKSWLIFYTLEKFGSRFCDAIITINQEDFHNASRMHCPSVYRIPSVGVDNKRFENINVDRETYRSQFGIQNNEYMILSVGELSARKNHQVIIRAISMLPEKEKYVFVVFGRVVSHSTIPVELQTLAEELGVKLILAGHRSDIPEANKCADVAVLPSIREGMGMAGLEAMASGLPVVGSEVQGIREYVKNGQTGWLCDPHNPKEFADAIYKICHLQKSEKEIIYQKCKDMARQFDKCVSVKKMKLIYEEVLND